MSNIGEFSSFTKADIEAARNMICKEAPDEIIRLILHRCAQLGCDPLARMIYAVLRNGKWQLQSSIDLFRSIASADADYGGQDGPFWCGEDGIWKDVWLSKEKPAAAKVGVYRKGFSAPTYAVANWDAYAVTGSQGFMWNKMPALMLAKTAEALALRKAFPQKLAGLYTNDEMAQADNGKAIASAPLPAPASVALSTEFDSLKALGRGVGKLQGAVNQDLQRLGGDVLALKAEYENALSQKNPRGMQAAASSVAATPSTVTSGTVEQSTATPLAQNAPAVDGEAGTPKIDYNVRDNIARGIPLDKDNFPRVPPEAPASEKTQAVMAVMTHAGFEAAFPAYVDKMKFCSGVTGKDISAWSQLSPVECEKILVGLNRDYGHTATTATESEIVQLQIHLKDADLVAYLKKSKAYLAAQEEGATQADSLRSARLAFAGWVLGHSVESFKHLTSAEVQTLFAKFQSMKSA